MILNFDGLEKNLQLIPIQDFVMGSILSDKPDDWWASNKYKNWYYVIFRVSSIFSKQYLQLLRAFLTQR